MTQFEYRAVTSAGELVSGRVEAPSHAEVIRRIEYLGHMPIEALPVAQAPFGRGLGLGVKAPRSRDITIFLRQLALLAEAGLTLEAALQTLSDDANRAVARFAADRFGAVPPPALGTGAGAAVAAGAAAAANREASGAASAMPAPD